MEVAVDPRIADWYVARKRAWIAAFIWWAAFWLATLFWFGRGALFDQVAPVFAGLPFPALQLSAARHRLAVEPTVDARLWSYCCLFWLAYLAFFIVLVLTVRRHLRLSNWKVPLPVKTWPGLLLLLGIVVLLNIAFIWLGLDLGRGPDTVRSLERYAAGQMQLHAFIAGLATVMLLMVLVGRSMTAAWVAPRNWAPPS